MITKLHFSVFIVTYSALNSELGFCEVSYIRAASTNHNQVLWSDIHRIWLVSTSKILHIQSKYFSGKILICLIFTL